MFYYSQKPKINKNITNDSSNDEFSLSNDKKKKKLTNKKMEKNKISRNNNNLNNHDLSNGEKYDSNNNSLPDSNSSLFRNNIYLTSYKIYGQKKYKYKDKFKTKTKLKLPKNLFGILSNDKEIKINEYRFKDKMNLINKQNIGTKQQTISGINLSKFNKKIRHIKTLNINQINIRNNINLPFLVPKSPITDRKSIMDYFQKYNNNNIKILNKIDRTNQMDDLTKIQRTSTYDDHNVRKKSNIISKKLLKRCKLHIKNNKFLALLNFGIKPKNKSLTKMQKEKVLKFGIKYINNKINSLKKDIPNKIRENGKVSDDGKKTQEVKKIQEYNDVVMFTKIMMKNNLSLNNKVLLYSMNYTGIIGKDIISYLEKKYFDIPLNKYFSLFSLYLPNEVSREYKFKKTLIRHQSIDYTGRDNIKYRRMKSKKTDMRLVGKFERGNQLFMQMNWKKKNIPELESHDKKYIYSYFFQKDKYLLETNDIYYFHFLGILRKNLNEVENQELLLEEFKHSFLRNKEISLLNNRSNRFKRNSVFVKNNNELNSNLYLEGKIPLSKILLKHPSINIENLSNKKTLLEYNLLFNTPKEDYYKIKKSSKMKRLSTQIYNSIKLKSNSKDVNGFKFDFIDSQLDDNKNPIIKMLKKNNIDQLANYIKNGNFESFKTLYRKSNCGPDELDSNGNSLLSIGVKSSNFQIINFLLNENANPNIEDVRLFYIII